MTRGRKIKQMRKFINNWGTILQERKLPPNPNYRPYRKGSYLVVFASDFLDLSVSCGDVDKYNAYKGIVEEIKLHTDRFFELEGCLTSGIQI